ncbi:hypothetical protein [Duganella fentianensis]|uniref:hypothetical protein n=1 Tax=Duganella fentianensis TaxID=2692177 RepID=UPI0032B2C77B
MKKNNDVYFITLIDLLVQVVFLGLLLYVVAEADQEGPATTVEVDRNTVERLLAASGVSNLTELTDELSKLAPVKELKGMADFIQKAGGPDAAKQIVEVVKQAGGAKQLGPYLQDARDAKEMIDKAGGKEKVAAIIKKAEEGSGKPPCLFTEENGKKIVKPLASIDADNAELVFEATTPELEKVLTQMNTSYAAIRKLTFAEFSSAFAPLTRIKPECRYTLRFIERTNFVHARDAASKVFYLNIVKSKPQSAAPEASN